MFASAPIEPDVATNRAADGRIYVLSEEGMTTVFAPGKTFQRLGVNHLDGSSLASIAVSDRSFFIRTDTHLYRIAEGGRQ